ncbi:MAG: 30S ribosomal protein S21 [Calditrichaeota bacterium]|nr:MAG: 30S ribosomal protein S21 [Calditrichota bacterium]
MVRVIVGERESIDSAIMRFKRKCERAGVLRDFKKSSYFIKPSQKKRMRRLKAIRRSLRIQAKTA